MLGLPGVCTWYCWWDEEEWMMNMVVTCHYYLPNHSEYGLDVGEIVRVKRVDDEYGCDLSITSPIIMNMAMMLMKLWEKTKWMVNMVVTCQQHPHACLTLSSCSHPLARTCLHTHTHTWANTLQLHTYKYILQFALLQFCNLHFHALTLGHTR